MSTTSSPDNLYVATTGDPDDPAAISAAEQGSVQTALLLRQGYTYYWTVATPTSGTAPTGSRGAQTGMRAGDTGYDTNTAQFYEYTGSAWVIWGSAPLGFSKTGTQSIGNGGTAATVTTMNAGEFSTNPGFSLSAGVFTCANAGLYNFEITALGATASAGQYGVIQITRVSGVTTTTYTTQIHSGSNAADVLGGTFSKLLKLATNDTVSFQIRQVSGANQVITYWIDCTYIGTPIA